MNDTVERSIIIVVELFIFITACIFAINGINIQEAAVNVVHKSTMQDEKRLFTDLKDKGFETYTGAEVLQSIYHIRELNADIRVNGYLFSKNAEIEDINVSVISLNRTYQVQYIRGSDGEVHTIVFS
ncbi:hypothetical protein [Paenibacillus azoreducens]|nr:hypothetical protein [Paenibacillus azoreducens]